MAPGIATSSPPPLRYGDHDWGLLLDEDPREVAQAIDCPGVERFLCFDGVCDVRWAVARRWRRDLSGESITLVVRGGDRIMGWAGLLGTDDYPDILQTSTFLHPDAWGTGLNVVAKHVQWAVVRLLGHDRMLLEIASDNPRSQGAAWKLFPSARVRRLASPDEEGVDVVLEVREAPRAGSPPDDREAAALAGLLRRHPGWHVWASAA